MVESRYGRPVRAPARYIPEDFATDDETDEDEDNSMITSEDDDETGSIESFIVDTDEDDAESDAVRLLVEHLCAGAASKDIEALISAASSGTACVQRLSGVLKDHVQNINIELNGNHGNEETVALRT